MKAHEEVKIWFHVLEVSDQLQHLVEPAGNFSVFLSVA
jgi:hypothetical protein